jgi:seryl-tRNA synthetase
MNFANPVVPPHHDCSFHFQPGDLDLLAAEIFRPSDSVDSRGHGTVYESVIDALGTVISRYRPRRAEIFRFPPVMSHASLDSHGQELLTSVRKAGKGSSRTKEDGPGALVLAPAACYGAYPIAAGRGTVPEDGYIFDVAGDWFRPEPSARAHRLQSFHMREYLRIGTARQIQEFRQPWIARARTIAGALGLSYTVDAANDPFPSPGDTAEAERQHQDVLKFELRVPISSEKAPTACMSFSDHRDHFGKVWRLCDDKGDMMHTGCVAFGMDQLAVALFAAHGTRIANWPDGVRETLKL